MKADELSDLVAEGFELAHEAAETERSIDAAMAFLSIIATALGAIAVTYLRSQENELH